MREEYVRTERLGNGGRGRINTVATNLVRFLLLTVEESGNILDSFLFLASELRHTGSVLCARPLTKFMACATL